MDRRQSPRKTRRIPVRIWARGQQGGPRRGYTRDLGLSGMGVRFLSVGELAVGALEGRPRTSS